MARTFNCGLGAVLVVAPPDAQQVLRQLQGEAAWIVGSLIDRQPGETENFVTSAHSFGFPKRFWVAGSQPVLVRNLNQSLTKAGPAEQNDGYHGNSSAPPQKKTRVGVLISGTGESSH